MEDPEKKPPKQREQETPDYSRRWFLRRSAEAALGLSLATGVDVAVPHGAEAEEAPGPELEAAYQEILVEFTAQLDSFEQQRIVPTEKEISDKLAPCTFIEQPLVIQTVPLTQKYDYFNPDPRLLHNNIETARERGEYREEPGRPTINRLNFFDAGLFSGVAFYDIESKSILVHELSADDQRAHLSRYIFDEAISALLSEQMQAIKAELDQTGDRSLYEQKRAAIYEQYEGLHGGELADIPKEWLVQHADELRKRIQNYRINTAEKYALTANSLPHEALHWFYDNGFQKEGYEGPSGRDCLIMALKNNHERYQEQPIGETAYGVNIVKLIMDLTGKYRIEESEIETVADAILERYDPAIMEKEGDDPAAMIRRTDVYRFVNEYLARIYNGALGNTDDSLAALTDIEMQKLGVERRPFKRDIQNHTPTEEELAFLKQMKYRGKSLLPE
ncbi:MAG: hypothetical protein ABIG66_03760 [Candidatus Kerfeldbacteria bacterium]